MSEAGMEGSPEMPSPDGNSLFYHKSGACFDFRVKGPAPGVEGDSPIFADHRFAAVPAKIGTVPKRGLAGRERPWRLAVARLPSCGWRFFAAGKPAG